MELSNQYDHKALRRYVAITIAMVAALKVTSGFAALLMPVFAFKALSSRKPMTLLYWVLFMTLTSVGNPILFSRNQVTVMTVRVTLVALVFQVAGRVFSSRSSRLMMPIWGIMQYMAWECLVSMQGYSPVISYLKIVLFFCIFLSLFGVANEVNASTHVNVRMLRSIILPSVALMAIGSVLLIPFPGISLMSGKAAMDAIRAGNTVSLFCGMCGHSQAMGPMAGVLGTFIFADLVFSIRKWDRLYVCMLLCCFIIAWKSASRTGMGTLIAGMGMATFLFMRSRGVGGKWKGKVTSLMTMLVIVGAVAMVAVPALRERVASFAVKAAKNESRRDVTLENMFSSRQDKIEDALYNFKQKPILGNGFQVSEDMAHEQRSGFLAYLMAPIEKGVWMYAVLEEGGVIGMALFCGWLLFLFPALYKRQAYIMACTFFAFMMANVGEFCVFAMTYLGGFYWALTFAAGTLDVANQKSKKLPKSFALFAPARKGP